MATVKDTFEDTIKDILEPELRLLCCASNVPRSVKRLRRSPRQHLTRADLSPVVSCRPADGSCRSRPVSKPASTRQHIGTFGGSAGPGPRPLPPFLSLARATAAGSRQVAFLDARTAARSAAPPSGRRLHCEEELRDPGERPPPLKKATPLSALRRLTRRSRVRGWHRRARRLAGRRSASVLLLRPVEEEQEGADSSDLGRLRLSDRHISAALWQELKGGSNDPNPHALDAILRNARRVSDLLCLSCVNPTLLPYRTPSLPPSLPPSRLRLLHILEGPAPHEKGRARLCQRLEESTKRGNEEGKRQKSLQRGQKSLQRSQKSLQRGQKSLQRNQKKPSERPEKPSEKPEKPSEKPEKPSESPKSLQEEKTRKAFREARKAFREARKAFREARKAFREARKAFREARKQKSLQRGQKSLQRSQKQRKPSERGRKAFREARKAFRETRKAFREARKAFREARKAFREARKAFRETRKAFREARKAFREARKAFREARKAFRILAFAAPDLQPAMDYNASNSYGPGDAVSASVANMSIHDQRHQENGVQMGHRGPGDAKMKGQGRGSMRRHLVPSVFGRRRRFHGVDEGSVKAMDPNFGIKRSVVSIRCPSVVVKAACVEREEKRPRGVLIPLYITDRGRARLAVHVQLQLCNPGIWVRPLLIPLDSGTGRIHAAVLNGGVVVLFVSRRENKHLETLTVGLLLPIPVHHVYN
ncbi:hypothetical protein D4764_01G0019080 [Takifugu flavidus]|uniref:Uncharacterized protein n=1 Tax=Takifugu flavidus TaxID=433684 RepID=A0A5C6PRF1_9TELE|nr:hypothetical protein D4764_01G0019080 [Takifugu flavidus]